MCVILMKDCSENLPRGSHNDCGKHRLSNIDDLARVNDLNIYVNSG